VASRKNCLIGLLLDNLHNDFFIPLRNGIEAVVHEKGVNLIVATDSANSRNDIHPPIGLHNTDELLVDEDIVNLTTRGFPMVLVHHTAPPSLIVPKITAQNFEITQRLGEHLLPMHRKRAVFDAEFCCSVTM
jgi:DNA-binding LacI/PurR family transcriptional regulator